MSARRLDVIQFRWRESERERSDKHNGRLGRWIGSLRYIVVCPVKALAELGLTGVLAAAFFLILAFRVDETRVFEENDRLA